MIVAGILTPLEDLLTWILTSLHETVGLTWAWSIVALVVIVRILLSFSLEVEMDGMWPWDRWRRVGAGSRDS